MILLLTRSPGYYDARVQPLFGREAASLIRFPFFSPLSILLLLLSLLSFTSLSLCICTHDSLEMLLLLRGYLLYQVDVRRGTRLSSSLRPSLYD